MQNEDHKNILINLHNNRYFKTRLDSLNKNLFNLKLEDGIRNTYVELLNKQLKDKYISIAEYPRGDYKRADLGICKIVKDKFELDYVVEFKFQFSGDYDCFNMGQKPEKSFLNSVFRPDFERKILNHQTDMFILFVSDWSDSEENYKKRVEFDKKFSLGINNLSRYQSYKTKQKLIKKGTTTTDWLKNLKDSLEDYANNNAATACFPEEKIECSANGIVTKYHVFIIYR